MVWLDSTMRALDFRLIFPIFVVCWLSLSNQCGLVAFEKATANASGRASVLTRDAIPPSNPITVKTEKRHRVFLGILTDKYKSDNDRFRTVIRKTYLQEHLQPIKICPFAERHYHCDIVYAFIELTEEKPLSTQDVNDVIYVRHEHIKNPLWAMYQHLLKYNLLQEDAGGDKNSDDIRFDFVSHTWTSHVLHPDRLWSRGLFDLNATGASVYGAYPRLFSWGTEGRANLQARGYRLLSSTLVRDVFNHKLFQPQGACKDLEAVLSRVVQDIGRTRGMLYPSLWKEQMMSGNPFSANEIALLPVKDAASKTNGKFAIFLVEAWDAYKDRYLIPPYQDSRETALMAENPRQHTIRCRHGPRMLLGIMSVLDDHKEIERRRTIRETYLTYYKKTRTTDERFRICALHELLDTTHPDHKRLLLECQLAYVFVIGGNSTGPTERVDFSAADPMTLPPPASEPDAVMLNIKENMNQGKTQTYFKYATMVCDNHFYFDYIAKTDTDSLHYVNKFLDSELSSFPSFPDNGRAYGGFHCIVKGSLEETEGVIYFAGSFFFLSPDMARFITSDECDRKRLDLIDEDLTIGSFVGARKPLVHRILVGKENVQHPLKDVGEYRKKWKRYMASMTKG